MNDLICSVSQIAKMDADAIWRCVSEIQRATLPWKEEYKEYQSSGWQTATLMNPTGNHLENAIYDGQACATDLLALLPNTSLLLNSLNLKIMWARVARLKPNSFLWEHIDYQDLNKTPKVRLHIPLATNSRSEICFAKQNVHLGEGYLWKLNPTHVHAACNLGTSDRIHLIIDCYQDQKLEKMISHEWLDEEFVRSKSIYQENMTEKLIHLNSIGYKDSALSLILKLFHKYDLTPHTSYDVASSYLTKSGLVEEAQEWQTKKKKYLGAGVAP